MWTSEVSIGYDGYFWLKKADHSVAAAVGLPTLKEWVFFQIYNSVTAVSVKCMWKSTWISCILLWSWFLAELKETMKMLCCRHSASCWESFFFFKVMACLLRETLFYIDPHGKETSLRVIRRCCRSDFSRLSAQSTSWFVTAEGAQVLLITFMVAVLCYGPIRHEVIYPSLKSVISSGAYFTLTYQNPTCEEGGCQLMQSYFSSCCWVGPLFLKSCVPQIKIK